MLKRSLMSLLFIFLFILGACGAQEDAEQVNNNHDEANIEGEEENNAMNESEEDSSFPVTLEIDGKKITIEEEPENILPLSLEVAEIVLELVETDRIPAATNGIDDPYLSTHSDISDEIPERIGAAINIDPEEIISHDTDLLLLTKMYGEQEDAEKTLEKLGTPIISFDTMVTLEQFMDAMLVIGEAVGQSEKAEEIVRSMKEEIEAIQADIPHDEEPSVLVLSEVGGDMGPLMMGPTNISYDLIQLVGAVPAVDEIGLERSTPAAIEQVLKMDPDYILLLDFFGKGEEGFADLMNDPGWDALTAVKEDRLKLMKAKYILNPNVENIEGLKALSDWLYHEREE